jgi:hypothetical protein
MARFQHPLDSISVAAPCKANWDDMIGTDRSRFCGQCSLNVYNLSGMTRREAEDLISQSEGRLCVRFFRRTDGTILTQNCPVGFAAAKARVRKWGTAVLTATLGFMSGVGAFVGFGLAAGGDSSNIGGHTMGTMAAPVRPHIQGEMTMGGIVSPEVENETLGKVRIHDLGRIQIRPRRTR